MISTKGRYSIRILLDLAEHRGVGYTPIKDVAARQSISLKYVEKLMPALKNAGLLDSSRPVGDPAGDGGRAGPGVLPANGRLPLPAGRGVPHPLGVGGLL